MTPIEQHLDDKTDWPDGPWKHEPDRVEWRARGMPCLILRNRMGALCGYVGLPPGHPWREHSDELDVPCDVHGGPTYLAPCDKQTGICHEPRAGETDDVVWLGFDCAHAGDLVPRMVDRLGLNNVFGEEYRDIPYVRAEVERLAAQAAEAMG